MVCVCASARLLNDQFKSCVHHSPAAQSQTGYRTSLTVVLAA